MYKRVREQFTFRAIVLSFLASKFRYIKTIIVLVYQKYIYYCNFPISMYVDMYKTDSQAKIVIKPPVSVFLTKETLCM